MSATTQMRTILGNLESLDMQQVESVYHDVRAAGAVIPSGEGRSKGALSIACSEMAKMQNGKVIIDRGDVGFPGRDLAEAAPVLRKRYGMLCLLINSGSGKSLAPLLDAQKLGVYLASLPNTRDFRIDLATSNPESPLGRLATKYGTCLALRGSRDITQPVEASEFKSYGIIEDTFTLSSTVLFQSMAKAMADQATAEKVIGNARELAMAAEKVVENSLNSDFFGFVLNALEQRKSCFFAGLGSSQEVVRMTAVRIGHVKRALGDHVYVAGETNTPAPRTGDLLIVLSNSGETEIVAGWCRNFKKMGGQIASVCGNVSSTISGLSDVKLILNDERRAGYPSDFYVKAAFALSPLPFQLVDRVEDSGIRLPDYIRQWRRFVTV